MAPDSERQWPPRSPHEALLSTPGGRQRYREMMNRTSPSPSPIKSARALAAAMGSPVSAGLGIHMPDEDDGGDEDDEDEETLQLKLQEIQARLKLKKLQKAKAKEQVSGPGHEEGGSKSEFAKPNHSRPMSRARTPIDDENEKPASQRQVQVPASPVRKLQFLKQQTSPSRVYLGIDKGLRAKDVSLERAPSHKGQKSSITSSFQNPSTTHHSRSLQPLTPSSEATRSISFSERLASARTEELERADRQKKVQRIRTNAFSIGQDEMEQFKKKAVEIPDKPPLPPAFTRDEVLSMSDPSASSLPRSKTTPNLGQAFNPTASSSSTEKMMPEPTSADGKDGKDEGASFEAYSCMHLSKRILPHNLLARHVTGKQVANVKDLLRDVKAPDFALPDVEQDIVVFATVARKSEPRSHKPTANQQQQDRGKYLVVTLTDLEFELDLFLFNSGFTRFWKLTEGTVIAILNPSIMPPPPGRQDTGRFSLVINSSDDVILEIGSARDLGFCQSMKKDGDLCGAWVNKKKTHFCEFHSNEAIRKQRSSRPEVNSSGFGGRDQQGRFPASRRGGAKKGNENYDWETRTQWFATRSHSAADLIDGKDRSEADKKERAEFVKRSLEAKEKERDLMKKLSRIGDAAGREYMERGSQKANAGQKTTASASTKATTSSQEAACEPITHGGLSLDLVSKDREIHLSPVKRKRPDNSRASSTADSSKSSASAAGFGWGRNLKDKLSKMKQGESLRKDDPPPMHKKTRFVTEKGIREAGRESLGMGTDHSERQMALRMDNNDDDEELVII